MQQTKQELSKLKDQSATSQKLPLSKVKTSGRATTRNKGGKCGKRIIER